MPLLGLRNNVIGRGLIMITAVVNHPEIEHKVYMKDFAQWLQSESRIPAEMSLKARLRKLLAK